MEDQYRFIEAYHKGKLTDEEKLQFEEAMAEDPDLREAVENYPRLKPVLDLLIEEDIRVKMQEISTDGPKIIPWKKWAGIAAALILGLVALFWLFSPAPEMTGPQLAARYYQEPPEMQGRGNTGETTATPQQIAIINAHKLIRENKNEDAEEILQSLVTLNSTQKEIAEWLLVITALKMDNKDLARLRLTHILDQTNHLYFAKASDLAKDLDLDH